MNTVHVITNGRPVFTHENVPEHEVATVVAEVEADPLTRAYVEGPLMSNMLPERGV